MNLESEFDFVYLLRERVFGVGNGVLGQSQDRGTGKYINIGYGRAYSGKIFEMKTRSKKDEGRSV